MSKKVKIPDCMSPFEVMVNGVKRVYPPGEIVSVPDEIAVIIEQHLECHGESGEINPGGGDSADFLYLKETLTEYRNDTITELPVCAFCGCKNLKMVVLPAVTSVTKNLDTEHETFRGCSSLDVIDFTALTCLAGASVDFDLCGSCNPIPGNVKAVINRGGLFQIGALTDDEEEYLGFEYALTCGITEYSYKGIYIYVPREYIVEDNFKGVEYESELSGVTCHRYPYGYDWPKLYEQNRIRAIEDYTVDGTVMGELDLTKMGIM